MKRKPFLVLLAIIAAGCLLRVFLVLAAEHRLGCDESAIAVMGLDILEGVSLPFFVYGTSYDGGGALEAYLLAAGFSVFGVTALVAKLIILAEWVAAAVLFADLSRRTLDGFKPQLAILFFCVGTPFFLEWSVKVRGGYGETLFLEILLLWLADPPEFLRNRPGITGAAFGYVIGIGLWVSEMLLPMVPVATLWLVYRCNPKRRIHTVAMLLLGVLIGVAPLITYNLLHDWSNLQQSVLAGLFRAEDRNFLTVSQLFFSIKFIFGSAWWILMPLLIISSLQLIRNLPAWSIGHVFLAHAGLYSLGFWISGLRFLPVPPSRVLFQLFPSIAVLFACATDMLLSRGRMRRWLAAGAICLWISLVMVDVGQWVGSKAPREAGSWRGSWSLVDAPRLLEELTRLDVDIALTNYWTYWPLSLEIRRKTRQDSIPPPMITSLYLPRQRLKAGKSVAFVLYTGSSLLEEIESQLNLKGIGYRQSRLGPLSILSQIDSAHIRAGGGFPPVLTEGGLPMRTFQMDGFN